MGKQFMNFLPWEKWKNKIKNLKKADYFIIILAGVLILIIAVPTDGNKKQESKKTEIQTPVEEKETLSWETYTDRMEGQLEKLLSQMEGVGKVKVMITLEDQGQHIVDKNITKSADDYEEVTVILDVGDEETPYVTREETPRIQGVFVVAEGGGNAKIVNDISEAVMALFDLEIHKIKIVEMAN